MTWAKTKAYPCAWEKKSLNIIEMQIHPKILLKLFAISVKNRTIFTKIIFKFIRKNKFMKSEGKCEKYQGEEEYTKC